MKILSIHDGHNASAAIFKDDKILSCVSEERINREKFYRGWPELSIKQVLLQSELSLDDIDVVCVSHLDTLRYIKRKFSVKSTYQSLRPKIILGHLYHIYVTLKRELKVRRLVGGHGRKKFFFCDHHLGHAASAYYYSGFDNALVVTIDAQGDSLSHTAYSVVDGKWKMILRGGPEESMGAFYAAITEGLGFKPNRHEGKIVGLAAFGDYRKIKETDRDFFVKISKNKLNFKRQGYYKMVEKVRELLVGGYRREDIAACCQHVLENLILEHINELCRLTKQKNLALAGGVFANVKLNQRVIEYCHVSKIFVQPAMGDEGIILGSAAYYLDQYAGIIIRHPIKDVYLGNFYTDKEIELSLNKIGCKYKKIDNPAQLSAQMINEGKIVGWFDGKMEFGPRALGHRTIMADPRRENINNKLNKRLKRSEFMPFAPSVLAERADNIFSNIEPARHASEFMTITFNIKKEWQEKIGAVVHVDGTARPQLVSKEINESYYKVINEFYKLTGIPLIINTSFNMHEEPVVCSPDDAWRAFEQGGVDCIIFNNKYLINR